MDALKSWIGKTERRSDMTGAAPVAALSATLDRDDAIPALGDPIPPLWHWLFFLPIDRQSELGVDGHARRGGFLPPVELPHRMWAGGRFEFHHPLRIGERVTRESKIVDVQSKQGRSGPLVFVTLRHEVHNERGLALWEEQDIVYRGERAASSLPVEASHERAWERVIHPAEVLLFRYSALTFNGHRIHYDRSYATGVEGYPGLVVHGPLIATLLLEMVRDWAPGAEVRKFSFRAVRPLFATDAFRICGQPEPGTTEVALWAETADGVCAMTANCTLAERFPPACV